MTILTPEVRAILKRMDADDAIDKAVELALEAAAKVCKERAEKWLKQYKEPFNSYAEGAADEAEACELNIRALKEQK